MLKELLSLPSLRRLFGLLPESLQVSSPRGQGHPCGIRGLLLAGTGPFVVMPSIGGAKNAA